MQKLAISIALGNYDHVRDLLHGDIQAEGMELIVAKRHPVEEIFHRFVNFREWDVSEMSFGKYVSLLSQPACDLAAIPVFPSRAFRHSSIYVRTEGSVHTPHDLVGKRVGIPEWAQTASIYSRGMLLEEYGVPLESVEWIQAGVNEAGRKEKVSLKLPPKVRYLPLKDSNLSDMLAAGEIDAVLSARAPNSFLRGDGKVRRLFDRPQEVELAYWKKTGIFPIMHVVAIRREVLDRHPWVAMNLYQAFEQAKRRSLERFSDVTFSPAPLPWIPNHADVSRQILGDDFWPYGIDVNRPTLEAFLRYAHDQGVCHRKLEVDELFVPSTLASVKV